MDSTIKLFESLKGDYNTEREHPEKFIASLVEANLENKEILDKFLIKLKPSQWIVLTIPSELLEKTLLRAQDLGFIDAYQQNPAFLKSDVDKIIKRISECDAYSIPYKNEKGKYQSWLFSDRGYNYIISQATGKDLNASEKQEATPNDDELRELANRVIETFALSGESANIYNRLEELKTSGLSKKEILMEVFKSYAENLDYLSTSIDEVLDANKEEEIGRVA